MTVSLAHILRHPIKSIGVEELDHAPLTRGRVLPFDRHWAVAHHGAKFLGLPGRQPEGWASKMNFLRGVAGPSLMAVTATLDEATGRVTLHHPDAAAITLHPQEDETALLGWLAPLWPDRFPPASHVVQVPGQAMTDDVEPYVSLLSLASLRMLSERMGTTLSLHRFRGNLWVEGWEAFSEFDLIGRQIRLGDAVLEVAEPITRCRATCVNPDTGVEDADTLAALKAGWGHQDFGLFCRVVESGTVFRGTPVEIL
jgi:uncharacterized protein